MHIFFLNRTKKGMLKFFFTIFEKFLILKKKFFIHFFFALYSSETYAQKILWLALFEKGWGGLQIVNWDTAKFVLFKKEY